MLAVVLVALPLVPGGHAASQTTPSPPPEGNVTVAVLSMPVSYEPGDDLDIRLRITNNTPEALDGFRIRIGVRDRVLSRLALSQSYTEAAGLEPSTVPVEVGGGLEPGSSRSIKIAEPVEAFPTLRTAAEGGVFPATFSVQEASGATTFGSVTVPLIYYPERPERPLELALLIPLNTPPVIEPGPEGRIVGSGLEEAVSESGWLTGYIEALEEVTASPPSRRQRGARPTPLRFSIAPTPRLIEELALTAETSEGAEETESEPGQRAGDLLERLRTLIQRDGVERVLVPYAAPDIPTIIRRLPIGHAIEQFAEAEDVWDQILGSRPGGWVYPPGGRLDSLALEQLQLLGRGRKVFFAPGSLETLPATSAGCPEVFLSFTCTVKVTTVNGDTDGFVADELLDQQLLQLRSGVNDRLGIQRVFAETAMIHEELPGTRRRITQATIPSSWEPTPRMTRLLLRGFQRAPWVRSLEAEAALARSASTSTRTPIEAAEALPGAPDADFYEELRRVREVLDSFGSAVPPNHPRLGRLRRNLLVATSRSWGQDSRDAARYVTASSAEVDEEMDKISLSGPLDITLTSQRSPLQLAISNETDYPVRLALRLVSANLEFDEERVVDTYPPGSRTLTFEATARGSGVSPLSIRLETGDGRYVVDERRIVVRSTSFNQVALWLTLGAFAFLVLFYIFKALRKQPEGSATPG